ncbi:MAG: response regulator [Candidatus Eisenbacteria bacterium]|nr:response regulator [Candidatus Eisenbacteria bacterium]MCC7143027.1 response regulator [Candidatus Eisenbacteria bacterium]
MKPGVLLIEDERQIHRFLRPVLEGHGYRVEAAMTGEAGLAAAAAKRPDVILLDLGLPDLDGLEVTRRLREWSRTPIIVLSARGREGDKVAALDAGADDYVTKPFGVPELLARVRVALRHAQDRSPEGSEPVFRVGDLEVDLGRRRVCRGGKEIHLTPIEYRLLAYLVRNSGRVVTHPTLLAEVWGPTFRQETHYLRVFMGQLRRKIEDDPARPRFIRTEPGVGYRLLDE